jgi:hypothetical protein
MTNEPNEPRRPQLTGCGWAFLVVTALFTIAILYILFNFGSWLGDL